jgi:hypothetical protein
MATQGAVSLQRSLLEELSIREKEKEAEVAEEDEEDEEDDAPPRRSQVAPE